MVDSNFSQSDQDFERFWWSNSCHKYHRDHDHIQNLDTGGWWWWWWWWGGRGGRGGRGGGGRGGGGGSRRRWQQPSSPESPKSLFFLEATKTSCGFQAGLAAQDHEKRLRQVTGRNEFSSFIQAIGQGENQWLVAVDDPHPERCLNRIFHPTCPGVLWPNLVWS